MIQSASERWNLFLGDKNIWNLTLPHLILFHKGIEDELRLWAKFGVLTKHTAPYHIEIVGKIVLNDHVLTFDASPIFQGIEVSQNSPTVAFWEYKVQSQQLIRCCTSVGVEPAP